MDSKNNFTPKEVAVLSVQKNIVGHWIVKPPHDFRQLREDIKNTNNYCTTQIHGIEWFQGDISLKHLKYHLYQLTKSAKKIYARGVEKTKYLEAVICRRVINFENYETPSFQDLQKTFPKESTMCTLHSQQITPKPFPDSCALYRVHLLKHFFQSILDDNYVFHNNFDLPSSYYHCALLNYQTKKRAELRNNQLYDEVDLIYKSFDRTFSTDDAIVGTSTPKQSDDEEEEDGNKSKSEYRG